MKHTIKKSSDTKIIITVSLNADDLKDVKDRTLKRLAPTLKVAGFRKGKVPVSVAEKHIDEKALNGELLEDAVNHATMTVVEEEKISLIDRPNIDVKKFVPGEQLEFTAEAEVLPEVKLGDYKKLKAKKESVEVTDAEIDEIITRISKDMSEKKEVDRPAIEGDEVTIDFDGRDEAGEPVEGAKGDDYPLVLGSKSFIPGFEEGLVGHKAGESFDLPLIFPKDYHAERLAGAKVTFKTTVKAIKEVVLPEANDEFAAKVGPFKTFDELKADIKRELTEHKEREAVEKFKDALIEQLIKNSVVPTPEILVNDQMLAIERDFAQNLMYRGINLDQYLEQAKTSKEDWQAKEVKPQAIRRVAAGLVLAELGKAEDIQITTEELDARLEQLIQNYGNDEKFKQQLTSLEARRDVANRLVTEKTLERLVELNK